MARRNWRSLPGDGECDVCLLTSGDLEDLSGVSGRVGVGVLLGVGGGIGAGIVDGIGDGLFALGDSGVSNHLFTSSLMLLFSCANSSVIFLFSCSTLSSSISALASFWFPSLILFSWFSVLFCLYTS